MLNSSRIPNQNQFSGNIRNQNGFNVGARKTNVPLPQQVRAQSFVQSNQPNVTNLNGYSSNVNDWQNFNGNSNVFSSSDSILSQALPKSFAAPDGWHSEVLESSSPIPNQVETNFNINNTNIIENNAEFDTSNPYDSTSIPYSNNEANRIVNEIPSTNINSSSFNEQSHGATHYCSSPQQQQVIVTNNRQASPVQAPAQPPVVIHKTLPNNTVTYNQNISVRYLQPPSPPPPGPIIIRKHTFS